VTAQNPAHSGETIIVYANNFFTVWPPPPIGFPTPSQPLFVPMTPYPGTTGYLFLQSPPQVLPGLNKGSCANTPALNVTFEGLAPGLVGVEQINFVVPSLSPGNYALFFNSGTSANGLCDVLGYPESSSYVMISVG